MGVTFIKAFSLRLVVGKVVEGPLSCLMAYIEVCVGRTTALIVLVGSGLQFNLLDLQGSDA